MARSEAFFRNGALEFPCSAEFVEIREVLGSVRCLLGDDELGFPEVVDGEIVSSEMTLFSQADEHSRSGMVVRKSISHGGTPTLNCVFGDAKSS